ncbi:MAG: alpha-N-arabinofuranosidase [Clostridia bacterium]|nr:alpha-N-arabinofuranosidase [Clostridia bacterium]
MNKLVINTEVTKGHINKDIQGQFSEHLGRCIYGGLYVGENSDIPNENGMRSDVVKALKDINLPVLRWPGGCFADEYHWQDGIGPKETRKKMVNTHWGGVTEDNSFGTHEFFELCRQIGCEAYVNGNVGSGSVREMNEWVEYMTFEGLSPMANLRKENGSEAPFPVKYFAMGNEPWGCGGNMTAEYYADEYRKYQTYVRQYGKQKIFKIAAGSNGMDYHWTETLMKNAGQFMDGLSVHYYTVPHDWEHKGSALNFTEADYFETLKKALFIDELITRHSAIMDQYDPQKRVALIVDEWGTWYDVEEGTNPGFLYQQNAMRDAMVAGLSLNIFNKHCDRVRMANIAQLVNVLQAMILTEGPRMLLTPTYFVFKLFKDHQENELLDSHMLTSDIESDGVKLPAVQESCSIAPDGTVHITLVNPGLKDSQVVTIETNGLHPTHAVGRMLAGGMGDHNTFEDPHQVEDQPFVSFSMTGSGIIATLPPCSVVHLAVK